MRIVKFVMVALLMGFIIYLSANTTSTRSVESVEKDMKGAMNEDTRVKGDFKELKRYYGLFGEDYDGFFVYGPVSAMEAEDLLVVRANTSEQADEVERAALSRVENQLKVFEGYGEKQVGLLKEAKVVRKGNYVFYATGADVDALEESFLESIRK